MPIKREFIAAKEITIINKYWLVPGTDSSGVYINGMTCFTVELTYCKLLAYIHLQIIYNAHYNMVFQRIFPLIC